MQKHLANFFENAVYQLGINRDDAKFNDEPVLSYNSVGCTNSKFTNHPSVKLIRDNLNLSDMFKFDSISLGDILREVKNLNSAKIGTFKYIPPHSLNEVSDIFNPFLAQIWSNEIIDKKIFPTNLKPAGATPVFKKKNYTLADNYRPVSIFPTVSNVFEKLM